MNPVTKYGTDNIILVLFKTSLHYLDLIWIITKYSFFEYCFDCLSIGSFPSALHG